jgi:hypothetical protein
VKKVQHMLLIIAEAARFLYGPSKQFCAHTQIRWDLTVDKKTNYQSVDGEEYFWSILHSTVCYYSRPQEFLSRHSGSFGCSFTYFLPLSAEQTAAITHITAPITNASLKAAMKGDEIAFGKKFDPVRKLIVALGIAFNDDAGRV